MDPEPRRRIGPLLLEVLRRRDHDQATSRVVGEVPRRRRERERRLAGTGGGNGQEVRAGPGGELFERIGLPRAEADAGRPSDRRAHGATAPSAVIGEREQDRTAWRPVP
jgi:hypothetical protein